MGRALLVDVLLGKLASCWRYGPVARAAKGTEEQARGYGPVARAAAQQRKGAGGAEEVAVMAP